ncbi:MAG: hypothetical protein WCT04_23245 [Planctomycetota bacterium]
MTEPPPRKRFQIHLSTAIVMMFVAGGLIWANVTGRFAYHIERSACYAFGWPLPVMIEYHDLVPSQEKEVPYREVSELAICCNIIVAVIILGFVCFICEEHTRDRATRK